MGRQAWACMGICARSSTASPACAGGEDHKTGSLWPYDPYDRCGGGAVLLGCDAEGSHVRRCTLRGGPPAQAGEVRARPLDGSGRHAAALERAGHGARRCAAAACRRRRRRCRGLVAEPQRPACCCRLLRLLAWLLLAGCVLEAACPPATTLPHPSASTVPPTHNPTPQTCCTCTAPTRPWGRPTPTSSPRTRGRNGSLIAYFCGLGPAMKTAAAAARGSCLAAGPSTSPLLHLGTRAACRA